jgi:DNA invertase Pin-like site-specific DNA recombinase
MNFFLLIRRVGTMTVYSYTRVSTRRQADEGESLGVQERQVAGYALMHNLTVAHTYVERGVSGSVPVSKRPEGSTLLARVKAGDIIIAAKMDRMFRDASDALNTLKALKERGVDLVLIDLGGSVTSNGIAKLVFTILAAVAEQEKDRICERVQTVKDDQAARGRYLGGKVPYGYRVIVQYDDDGVAKPGGTLEPVEVEQVVIRMARDMKARGASLRTIKRDLELTLALDVISRLVA